MMADVCEARKVKLLPMALESSSLRCFICNDGVVYDEDAYAGHLAGHVEDDSTLLTRFDSLIVKQFEKKLVSCDKCNEKFTRQIDMDVHKLDVHMHKYLLICKYSCCSFNTINREELIAHEQLHKVVERCPYCADFSICYGDWKTMRRHYDDKHSKWGCVCRGCEERFPSMEEVDVHEQKHCDIFVSKYPDLLRS